MADFPLAGYSHVLTGDIGSASVGAIVTASATAHTLGVPKEIIASTAFDSSLLILTFSNCTPVINTTFMMNVLIGASASEEILVENIIISADTSLSYDNVSQFNFPLLIPKGSRISVECQSAESSASTITVIASYCVSSFASHSGYAKCVTLGATAASTTGVTVDGGATAHTLGAWSEISASSPDDYAGFFLSVSSRVNTGMNLADAFLMQIGIGAAASEMVIVGGMLAMGNNQELLQFNNSF